MNRLWKTIALGCLAAFIICAGAVDVTAGVGTVPGATVYENGEDGGVEGWSIFDRKPRGAAVTNVYDGQLGSRVIELSGSGTSNGYRLRNADGGDWGNSGQFIAAWTMQFAGKYNVCFVVSTTRGTRYMCYDSSDGAPKRKKKNVTYRLGSWTADGRWYTFVRDLQADFSALDPGQAVLEVRMVQVRGSGRMDDIQLLDSFPATLDSDNDGITDADEGALYGTDGLNSDSDGDGLSDGAELAFWGDDWNADSDGDGLINLLDADSDGDGFIDGEEAMVEEAMIAYYESEISRLEGEITVLGEENRQAVDANGNVIGKVMRVDTSLQMMQVAVDVNGAEVIVNVRPDSFSHGARPLVYFNSPDCSGAAFISAAPNDTTLGAPAAVSGGVLYLGTPGASIEQERASVLQEGECKPFGAVVEVMAAEPVMDLGALFTPPYDIAP